MSNTVMIIGASSDLALDLIKNYNDNEKIIAVYNNMNAKLQSLCDNRKNIIHYKVNLLNEDEIYKLLETLEQESLFPNKIVNFAASKFTNIRFKENKWEDFQKDFDISLKSYFIILNSLLPKLVKLKIPTKVVTILSSVTKNVPPKNLVHYTTVKYSLLGFTKALASEYSNKDVTINAISPSMIETKFLSEINEKVVELSAYSHPKKRNAKVDDITPTIKYLLSNESSFITGENITISGGLNF